jgi:hypothetical protein
MLLRETSICELRHCFCFLNSNKTRTRARTQARSPEKCGNPTSVTVKIEDLIGDSMANDGLDHDIGMALFSAGMALFFAGMALFFVGFGLVLRSHGPGESPIRSPLSSEARNEWRESGT